MTSTYPEADLSAKDVSVIARQLRAVAALLGWSSMYSSGSDWSKLLEYTGFSHEELGRFIVAMTDADLVKSVIVPAQRTPIGGRSSRRTVWQSTQTTPQWARDVLSRYRRRKGADERVIEDLGAALRGEAPPSLVAARERVRAAEAKARDDAERARTERREVHRRRLVAAIETAREGGPESDELRAIVEKASRLRSGAASTPGFDSILGLSNYLDGFQSILASDFAALLEHIEPHADGVAWALIVGASAGLSTRRAPIAASPP
ncbi:MAG: hypothetical protein KF729_33540 [Sandaracinaceae bacterium]|nr:hypothetical protein [Sandaracinaceae bacterium]